MITVRNSMAVIFCQTVIWGHRGIRLTLFVEFNPELARKKKTNLRNTWNYPRDPFNWGVCVVFHAFRESTCWLKPSPRSMLHIGNRIKEVFDKQPRGCTVVWLAGQLHCRRGNIYDIFSRSSIDSELLWRLSMILNHDFFKDLSSSIEIADTESDTTRSVR